MEFRILGAMEVLDTTHRLDLPKGRGRALLALLVLHAGETVPAERLVDALWDEHPPTTASTVVHGLVSRLRRTLEPDRAQGHKAELLQTVGTSYRLAIQPEAVDANRFKRLIDEARSAAPDVRAAGLSAALGLWRGPALADFTYMPFAQRAISALEELRIEATEDRIEAELELGRGRELVPELEALVHDHPFRERLRGFLMLALYRAGRQIEALEAYRVTHALLVDEMGVEPEPALRDLQAAILRQDPGLDLHTRRGHASIGPAGASWLPRERRSVTVVAADLTPSGEDDADVEAVAHFAARAANVATEVLERHGARVERVLGPMVMGFFGFPVAYEDQALRAARAAVEVGAAVGAINDEPSISGLRSSSRVGIETGDIVVRGPGTSLHDLVGPVMSAATRLQQVAADGAVIVGPGTQRLLRGAVILQAVRGFGTEESTPKAWRVLEILSRAQVVPRALESSRVGRETELTRLRSAFRRVVRSGGGGRFAVFGDAGIGKSRLAKEFVASIGTDAHAVTLNCPAYGTMFPMRQAIVQAAGLTGWRTLHDLLAADNDGQHIPPEIAVAIGLQVEPSNADSLFSAMYRLFAQLSAERPLIVVLDDLHWAEPTFLDLIDRLDHDSTARIFLLCVGRPDLIERRPAWDTADVLHVDPLPPEDLESLIRDRVTSITPVALRRIMEISQGNPLFAEQLLATLDDATDDPVPASLLGLLTMRLDRLGPAERDLLRCASIVGMDVDHEAVSVLVPEEARPFLPQHLETLERRRLIDRSGARAFRFSHVLIQLTAYQSMTREDRAQLHERYADWLEGMPDREPKDSPAYHLAQAADHRRSSGLTLDASPVR